MRAAFIVSASAAALLLGCTSSDGSDGGGATRDAAPRDAGVGPDDGGGGVDGGETDAGAIEEDAGPAAGTEDAGPAAGTVDVLVTRDQVPVADALIWSRRAMARTDATGRATIEVAAIDAVSSMVDYVDPPSPTLRQLRTWTSVLPGDVLAFEIGDAGPIRPRSTLRLDLVVPSPPATGEPDLPYLLYFCGGYREVDPAPGPVEVMIDPDCDVGAGVELLLENPTSAQETLHTRTTAPSGGAVDWDPGAEWELATVPVTVAVEGIPSDASLSTLRAAPLTSAQERAPWISRGVSATSDGDHSVLLPSWASHVELSFELVGFEVLGGRQLAPREIGPDLALDVATILSSPTGGSVTVEGEGTLRGTWDAVDARADVIVIALDLTESSGSSPTLTFNWQIMIDPRATTVGPLRVPAGSWLDDPSARLNNVIVIDEDAWEGFDDARAAMASADWHLRQGPGSWSLGAFAITLE